MTRHTIYAIPGTMCDERIWSKINDAARSFTLVHVPIPKRNSIDEIVESLAQQLPNARISLMGFSLGGYLAAAFCLQYPERIKRLVIVSNTSAALPTREITLRRELMQWLQDNEYTGMGSKRILSLLHTKNKRNSELLNIIADMDRRGGKSMLLSQLNSTTQRQDLSPALREIKIPMDFIYGDADILVTESIIEHICQFSHTKTLYKVADAGHMLPLEKGDRLAEILNTLFI